MQLVTVGLGYVGLPLVQEAVRAGINVVGLDVSETVVAGLNSGQSHVGDLSEVDIRELLDGGFKATSDPSVVADADVVVICVPTPLSDDGGPDLSAVRAACRDIASNMVPGTLVVLESTTYPGTTVEVVTPLLEDVSGLVHGEDFHVAYSPERIDPGNARYGLRNTPKVVGSETPAGTAAARSFYSRVVDEVVVARGTREAESAKLLENTYRHVNIALVNEMARFFHELGVDFWDVIDLASTKPFGFQAFTPGPGVGGHCIPIDPNYLSHRVRSQLGYGFRFVELAQEINAAMPAYVAQRIGSLLNSQAKPFKGSVVLLLGVSYKPDIADMRESPALDVAERLLAAGARVIWHDPYVENWDVHGAERADDLDSAVRQADVTVLLQNHRSYDISHVEAQAQLFFDTRGVSSKDAHRL